MPVISPLGKWSLAATILMWYPGYVPPPSASSTTGCRVIFRPVRAPGQNGGHLPGLAGVGHDPNNAGTPQYHHPNSPPYINNHSEIFMTSLPSDQGEGPRVRSSLRRQECRGTPSHRKQDTPERPQPGHMEGGEAPRIADHGTFLRQVGPDPPSRLWPPSPRSRRSWRVRSGQKM